MSGDEDGREERPENEAKMVAEQPQGEQREAPPMVFTLDAV
jgi:hypothetical protein